MELQELTDTIQNNKKFMQELIDKLIEKTGINPDQAQKALETIKALCEPVETPKTSLAYIHFFCGNPENKDDLNINIESRFPPDHEPQTAAGPPCDSQAPRGTGDSFRRRS